MPELPEVETTRRGLARLITEKTIKHIHIHQPQLRWPVPDEIHRLEGQQITGLKRRGKYLLIEMASENHILMHLGMSGSISVVAANSRLKKHDHFEIILSDQTILRFHDPRRFGCILLTDNNPEKHALLSSLGPEPLDPAFNGQWLKDTAGQRKVNVKNFIMNAHVVVGVGNIYASEALYKAGIHPKRAASRISLRRYHVLAQAIKSVLEQAIEAGGTTLQDFSNSDGKPGYFQQQLQVYGRQGKPCNVCNHVIKKILIANRSSFYCQQCQH